MADQSLGALYAELALKTDKLQDGAQKSTAVIRKLNTDIDRLTDDINAKLESIGKGLSIGVTAPLALLGYTATKTFTSFEQAMQNTYSVMGASAAEMEQLRYTAEKMGADTRFSASQAADALYSLGSAGQNAQQAIKSLDGVLALAGATQSDLAFTSETLSSTLSQFNLDASQSARVADVYAQAISKSQANMNKLAYSMRYVGPIAAGMGQDLEGTTAALMALYNAGYQGEQAGTIMRGALTTLANETADLDKKLSAVGLTYQEVNPQINSFADIIGNISKKTTNTSDVIKIFGDVAGSGMAKLVAGGDEAIRTFDQMLSSSEGAASAMQKIQNTSLANTVDEMTSAWEGLQITITDNVEPAITAVIKAVTEALRIINDLPPGFQVAGTTALAFAAAAGPILLVAVNIKKLKNEMAMLNIVMTKNPFIMWGAIAAGAVTVVAGIVAHVRNAEKEFERFAQNAYESADKISQDIQAQRERTGAINSLLEKYDRLSSIVNRSSEQQQEYNDVFKELKDLLPGLNMEIDAHGNAVALDADKARAAALKNIETEEALIQKELSYLNISKTRADTIAKTKKTQIDANNKILQSYQDAADAAAKEFQTVSSMTLKYEELKEKQRAGVSLTKQEQQIYARLAGELTSSLGVVGGRIDEAETAFNKANKALDDQTKKTNELNSEYNESIELLKKIADKTAEANALRTAKNSLSTTPAEKALLTQQEAVSNYLDGSNSKWKQQQESINKAAKEAEKYGETYNVAEKKAEALAGILREMIALQPGKQIADGFTLDNTLLAPWFDALSRLKIEAKDADDAIKNLGKNKSQGTRLTELDTEYKYMIEIAKANGRDTYDIEQEWYAKRIELAESFILEDRKNGISYADSVSSRLKGTNKTIGEIIKDSKLLVSTEMQALIHEYEVNQKKLDDAQQELSSIDAQLIVPENIIPDSALAQLNLRKEELLKLIEELKNALGMDVEVVDPLKDAFEKAINIENVKMAEDAQKRYTASLVSAQSVLERGTTEWMKIQKEIDDSKKKVDELKQKQATAFINLASPIASIGQSLADAIAVGITEGGEEGVFTLISQIGSMTSSIGTMIGDPMTMAIGQSITAITGIIGTLYSAVDNAQKKAEQGVKDYNDEVMRSIEKRVEESRSYADSVVGDLAKKYAKAFQSKKVSETDMLDSLLSEAKVKAFEKRLEDLKNTTAYFTDETRDIMTNKGHWEVTWSGGWEWKGTTYEKEAYQQAHTLNEAITEYVKADTESERKKWEKIISDALSGAVRDADIDLAGYATDLDSVLSEYILGNVTLDEFKKSLNERIQDTVLSYLLETMALNQVQDAINKSFNDKNSPGEITSAEFEQIFSTAKSVGDQIQKAWQESVGGVVQTSKTGLSAISDEWASLGESITSSLSDALGEAAFDADYASFRNSFAEQMKKAIIQSAIKNFGVAEKVQAIINGAMADGVISGDEVTDAIGQLQTVYNKFEASMGSISQIVNGLTDAEIKSETSGTIIQQLSGSDRDYLAEAIRNALSLVTQTLNFPDAAIQSLTATQLIINSLNYNHSGNIYVQATEDTDLRSLLGELITQALGSK